MTEEDKLYLAQPLTDIYTAMETDLMMAIAEQLAYDGGISPSSEWRLRKLAEAGALTKQAVKIIASYTGIQSEMLSEAVEIAALDVINELEPAFAKMAADGLVSGAPEVPASATARSIVSHYRRQAATDLNLVNTVMQYKAVSSYKYLVNKMYDETKRQEALNNMGKHTLSVVTGAESRQQAVRNCIREFSRNGIPAFVDKAGREWSPEAYVNMDIRTTVSNTAHAAQDAVCDRYDVDLIEISSHMGARPKCAPYQGKVFSRKGQSGVAYDGKGDAVPYSPLSETSYGQPDGIFGINCRHKKYPFVSGASFRTYFPYDEEENAERYKAFQKQRYMERRVREASREAEMLKIAGDEQGAKDARLKAKNRRAEYRKYCSDNGLKERNDRLKVVKAKNGENVFPPSAGGAVPAGGGLTDKVVRKTPKNVLTKSDSMLYNIIEQNELSVSEKDNFESNFLSGFNALPKHHQEIIRNIANKHDIHVFNSGVTSGFDWESKNFRFNYNAPISEYIHEFAHAIYDHYELYNSKEFISILSDGLDLSDWSKIKPKDIKDIYGNVHKVYLYQSDKFIDEYQGRLYFNTLLYNNTKVAFSTDAQGTIDPILFQEYFSVGYEAYFYNREMLKSKDVKLFNFIERMIKNGD